MAWPWRRSRREQQDGATREDAVMAEPAAQQQDGSDREEAVLAELTVQQQAMNELSIADFLAGVDGHHSRAATPPAAARERRRDAVRRHRVDGLVRSGVVDADAAALLADDELATGEALVLDGGAWGRWPEQSAISEAAEGTRAAAAQLPDAALAGVKINVSLVPQEDTR